MVFIFVMQNLGIWGLVAAEVIFFVESPIFGTSNSYFPILFKILKGFN